VWEYCEASAAYIFGSLQEDPVADTILDGLRRCAGMTRSEISGLFDRHQAAARIDHALHVLHTKGLARFEREETGGRPRERWFAVSKA